MPETNFGEQLAQQSATQAANNLVGSVFGLALEGHNDRRQLKQQRKLQNMQMEGQMAMTDYNMKKQFEMWQNTSYPAQVEQMKKAGVNPALMYGIGGGGGQSTGNPTGNVQGADAPKGGHEIIDSVGMGIQGAQLQLLQAQKENIEADTENKRGDTANKPKVGENIEANTANLVQSTDNLKTQKAYTEVQTDLAEIQKDIQGSEINDMKAAIRYGMRKLYAEMEIAETQSGVDKKTAELKVKQAKATVAVTVIDAWLKSEQARAVPAQVIHDAVRVRTEIQQMMQGWNKLRQGDRALGLQEAMVDYSTAVPPELKELLDNVFIVPTTKGIPKGTKPPPVTGFRQ